MHRPRKTDVERYQAAVRAEQERRRPLPPVRPTVFIGTAGA
jgi:hypothetical protein